MIMRFAWVSWKPPDLSPEAELQFAQAMSAVGKAPFIKRFWGLSPRELPPSENSFFETHAAGLIYVGLILAGFFLLDGNSPPPKKGSGGDALTLFVAVGWLGTIIFYGSMVVAAGRYATWLTGIERKYRIPPNQAPPPQNQTADDNAFYEAVAREIEQGQLDKVIWTRAVANSAGDDKLARSLYVRYRAEALQEAHSQRTRAEHEAQVLARERQKFQERQAKEAADRNQAEANQKGCGIAVLVVIGFFVLIAVINGISDSSSQPSSSYSPPSPPRTPPTPSIADRRADLARRFTALDAEYRELSARRASLDPNDQEQIAAFNRAAADYTRRTQEARAEKARLDQ
jgi:hypothetical protein